MLSGLIAQDYDPVVAAVFGVYLHGAAGDIAVNRTGFQSLTASDLIAVAEADKQNLIKN